jgi:DNA-binding NarL/FixJ family response regulator
VLLLSYNESDAYRHEALASGANNYVTKSDITTGAWLQAVVDLLGGDDEDRHRR